MNRPSPHSPWSTAGLLCLGFLGAGTLGTGLAYQDELPLASAEPEVSIVWPEEGAEVGGDVSVFVPSQEGLGLVRVEVLLDDTRLLGALPAGVYALSWDTRDIPPGPHTLTARASSASGRTYLSAPVRVEVGEPLSVRVSSPEPGAVRSGALSLSADVTRARGPAWVQFLTEDRYLCGVQGPPYTCEASTRFLPDGPLSVRAEVYDEAGNHALSEAVTVILDRAGSTLSLTLPTERASSR
ncbi:MAG: Ig-like domain-containing protein [Cystobacter sp.]